MQAKYSKIKLFGLFLWVGKAGTHTKSLLETITLMNQEQETASPYLDFYLKGNSLLSPQMHTFIQLVPLIIGLFYWLFNGFIIHD